MINNPLVLILDFGTQSVRTALINKQGENYTNNILTNVYHLHVRSVEFLTYIFKTIGIGNTKKFWNFIELYFMGVIPQEVEEQINSKKISKIEK